MTAHHTTKTRGLLLIAIALLLVSAVLCPDTVRADPLPGKFYVIGTGPAGPEHATLKAIDTIKKADLILCSESMEQRFSQYLHNKPIMNNHPWKGMFSYKGKSWRDIVQSETELVQEFARHRIAKRDRMVRRIQAKMREGKTVALLNSGDPCLFGPCHWFVEGFDPANVEIIPGVGAFSAAMAALKKSSIPAYDGRFVLQSAPSFLFDTSAGAAKQKESPILKHIAQYPGTLAFYMALPKLESLVAKLKAHYSPDLPIAIVYHAGYPEKEKVVKANLQTILQETAKIDENWLGMVIVGSCLQGKPYRTRAEALVGK